MLKHLIAAVLLHVAVGDICAADRSVVIYDGGTTKLNTYTGESKDLWLTTTDLTRVTRFALKPEGICRDDRCIPIPEDRRQDFIVNRGDDTLFNLSAFARLLKQPIAVNAKHRVWYFGPEPAPQNAHIISRKAPDFTLPDWKGKERRLSEFRGKKVLLITWASW